ncbi:MAG: leucine-rich repeat protein [Methanobrevibacter sp.]|nr:leucine-rich repeat protein [Methanobrevibacter sp.]
MSVKTFTVSYIQAIADAIRAKNGLTRSYKVSEMPEAILDIQSGNDLILLMTGSDSFNLDEDTVPTASTIIPAYMFYSNQNIRNINYDTLVTIGNAAFQNSKVNKIILPGCTSVGASAFLGCAQLSGADIDLQNCTSLGNNAFQNCNVSNPINSINLDKLLTIGDTCFQDSGFWKGSSNTAVLNLPKCTTIGARAFDATVSTWSNRFAEIHLPDVVDIGGTGSTSQVFRRGYCTNLYIGEHCTNIGTGLFYSGKVNNIYIEATTPPTLRGAIGSDTSVVDHIYVPADSVDTYKAASNWSSYASKIEAIPV